jgi:hypothetical protein
VLACISPSADTLPGGDLCLSMCHIVPMVPTVDSEPGSHPYRGLSLVPECLGGQSVAAHVCSYRNCQIIPFVRIVYANPVPDCITPVSVCQLTGNTAVSLCLSLLHCRDA